MKCTQVAKIKLIVLLLLLKQYGSQSQKMVFFRLLHDHKRYEWYESEDKSCQYRNEDNKNQIIYLKKVQFTSEKVKIIEVLCMKENN